MRKFIALASIIFILLTALIAGAELWITYSGSFHPGNPIYPLQIYGERVIDSIVKDETGRAEFALNILLRRLDDLYLVAGTEYEDQALTALSQALDQAASAVAAAPETTAGQLLVELSKHIQSIEGSLNSIMANSNNPDLLAQLVSKVSVLKTALISMLSGQSIAPENLPLPAAVSPQNRFPRVSGDGNPPLTQTPIPFIEPHFVLFPPNSPGALHEFYPLTGKHAFLNCADCHRSGKFTGTENLCLSCHLEVKPTIHYQGECSTCHTPEDWRIIHFEHNTTQATDCAGCHTYQRPADHYNGQCSACHNTNAWLPASFNHQAAGASDCQSCHSNRTPANHYSGQCSACHNSNAWLPASFNHQAAGASDCQSCHNARKPANHYSGQCSACHNTSAWQPASFNHQAAGASDCQSCHSDRTPAGHYSGPCSACHNTNAWQPASFNHQAAGASDCQACHSNRRPTNHYDGQCSMCHDTTSWANASFSHNFPTNHGDADGECAACHPSGTSNWSCYNCHDQAKMESKHAEKEIFDIASRCLECHPQGNKD
jgi:hypothetical protein